MVIHALWAGLKGVSREVKSIESSLHVDWMHTPIYIHLVSLNLAWLGGSATAEMATSSNIVCLALDVYGT